MEAQLLEYIRLNRLKVTDTDRESSATLATICFNSLHTLEDLSNPWNKVLKYSKLVIRAKKQSTIDILLEAIDAALYSSFNEALAPINDVEPEYLAREEVYLNRVENPKILRKEANLLSNFSTATTTVTIIESSTDYGDREDAFKQRISNPGAFRRSS
mgnify:CR=1 FL=1|tara:strand:+ start:80 stop:553 length:474 start_codon:yes stop_codon:yes gene_type:complete